MNNNIDEAVKILNQSGTVIFPTDTAFGVGCRMDNEEAVKRLFAVRNRPETQATPVLVNSMEMATRYLEPLPEAVLKLMKTYWPGALTIIYRCKTGLVPKLVRGGGETLGVRMPDHPLTLELIRNLGVPLLGPSANFHGQKTPYKYEDLDPEFIKKVDYVIKGECKTGNVSTVVDCTTEPFNIIRQGAIIIR